MRYSRLPASSRASPVTLFPGGHRLPGLLITGAFLLGLGVFLGLAPSTGQAPLSDKAIHSPPPIDSPVAFEPAPERDDPEGVLDTVAERRADPSISPTPHPSSPALATALQAPRARAPPGNV